MKNNIKFYYELTNEKSLMVYDPVIVDNNGNILPYEIPYPYSKVFLTKEMQRLRYITQCGPKVFNFPNLEYDTRFSHSIEAFYMMNKLLNHLEKKLPMNVKIPEEAKKIALLGISVHDIGHGPGSHLFEKISNKSHEERTSEILNKSDTDIHKLLIDLVGPEYIKLIEDLVCGKMIKNCDNSLINKYLKLISFLMSSPIDADKLAYLKADSYYTGIKQTFSSDDIINEIAITIDENGKYIPTIKKENLSSFETMRNFRAQMYRDVYLNTSDGIMNYYYSIILQLYNKYHDSINLQLPEEIKKLTSKSISTDDFLNITEPPLIKAMDIIKDNSTNPLLSYMCDRKKLLNDCRLLQSGCISDELKEQLSEVFGGIDISYTNSVFNVSRTVKIVKDDEYFFIDCGDKLIKSNSDESANMMLDPKENQIYINYTVFNPEVLRLELEKSPEEFAKYSEEINRIMINLNKKPEEMKLRYVIPSKEQKNTIREKLIETFLQNGWKLNKSTNIHNTDEYYDTGNMYLLKQGSSLRIRKSIQGNEVARYTGSYKFPINNKNTAFFIKKRIEKRLVKTNLNDFIKKLLSSNEIPDRNILKSLMNIPVLTVITNRKDIILEKDGIQICISFDDIKYKNQISKNINKLTADDNIIEVKVLGNIENRVVLNILNDYFKGLKINNENTYKRGVRVILTSPTLPLNITQR